MNFIFYGFSSQRYREEFLLLFGKSKKPATPNISVKYKKNAGNKNDCIVSLVAAAEIRNNSLKKSLKDTQTQFGSQKRSSASKSPTTPKILAFEMEEPFIDE